MEIGNAVRIIVVLLAAGGAGFYLICRLRDKVLERVEPPPTSEPASVEFVEADEPPSPPSSAEKEFAQVCHKFEGLYEGLHRICTQDTSDDRSRLVLKGWESRIHHVGGEALKQAWRALVSQHAAGAPAEEAAALDAQARRRAAQQWYGTLKQWGVQRDHRQRLEIHEDLYECYFFEGEHRIGENAEVELPCWFFQKERVIEKGMARVIHA